MELLSHSAAWEQVPFMLAGGSYFIMWISLVFLLPTCPDPHDWESPLLAYLPPPCRQARWNRRHMETVSVTWPTREASRPHFGSEGEGTWKEAAPGAAVLCPTPQDAGASCAASPTVSWLGAATSFPELVLHVQNKSGHVMQKQISTASLFSVSPLKFRARLGFECTKTPAIIFLRFLPQIGRNLSMDFALSMIVITLS